MPTLTGSYAYPPDFRQSGTPQHHPARTWSGGVDFRAQVRVAGPLNDAEIRDQTTSEFTTKAMLAIALDEHLPPEKIRGMAEAGISIAADLGIDIT